MSLSPTARRAPLALSLALALAACAGGGPDVEVPTPKGEAAQACRELAPELPRQAGEQERRTLDQDTPYAAVWGDPAIVLRCGVGRPEVITPGSDAYVLSPDSIEVNGVSWLIEEEADGLRCTTTGREVFVEVTVPDDYETTANPLVEISGPVDRHIPLDALWSQLEE
ncbi:DUF3515 domain-containing protein [Streptomyces sp. B6B3]|uniref:DUF3515 domain-containing protein n=1 Tax=Streptomyces sp. B6B3 TaxID=3153570 RepID=UPI00325F0581